MGRAPDNSVGVYIGIPFCPTRCLYCSFTSNQENEDEIARYMKALHREIRFCGRKMKETGLKIESLYIGGGTPTTLSAAQLAELFDEIYSSMDMSECREFTVEAGRPDTVTVEKLEVIKASGADRISINPQSMKAKTLELVGRSHTPGDITEAFRTAHEVGIKEINADVIAGLPEESVDDFVDTLKQVIALNPENITVHTLAVKRASRLIEQSPDYHYSRADTVKQMLDSGVRILSESGFKPYYLYRQKHMAGAFENVGYCRNDCVGIYNIRIMEEKQSILALGAGGISKKYFPREDRLERVPNVSNYRVYIDRIEEMLERKRKNFFEEV